MLVILFPISDNSEISLNKVLNLLHQQNSSQSIFSSCTGPSDAKGAPTKIFLNFLQILTFGEKLGPYLTYSIVLSQNFNQNITINRSTRIFLKGPELSETRSSSTGSSGFQLFLTDKTTSRRVIRL